MTCLDLLVSLRLVAVVIYSLAEIEDRSY